MGEHDNTLILYHSSTVEVANPRWDFAVGTDSERNDFGLGFYTAIEPEQPLMLLCDQPQVVLNTYRLDLTGLSIKRLSNDTEWLMSVVFSRRNFNAKPHIHSIRDRYRKSLEGVDIIIGAIANDRLFSTINAFIENNITDAVATACLKSMQYQPQYVQKSNLACSRLAFLGSEVFEGHRLEGIRARVVRERELMEDRMIAIKEQLYREGRLLSEILREEAS